jgi:hypothetical protein
MLFLLWLEGTSHWTWCSCFQDPRDEISTFLLIFVRSRGHFEEWAGPVTVVGCGGEMGRWGKKERSRVDVSDAIGTLPH